MYSCCRMTVLTKQHNHRELLRNPVLRQSVSKAKTRHPPAARDHDSDSSDSPSSPFRKPDSKPQKAVGSIAPERDRRKGSRDCIEQERKKKDAQKEKSTLTTASQEERAEKEAADAVLMWVNYKRQELTPTQQTRLRTRAVSAMFSICMI